MGENPYENGVTNTIESGNIGNVKNISDAIKKVNVNSEETSNENAGVFGGTDFKVTRANTNLPEKTGFWTKLKNVLFYEVKVELSPYQQKVENEINDFLHADITWKSLKEAALSEVPITFRGKRIF